MDVSERREKAGRAEKASMVTCEQKEFQIGLALNSLSIMSVNSFVQFLFRLNCVKSYLESQSIQTKIC